MYVDTRHGGNLTGRMAWCNRLPDDPTSGHNPVPSSYDLPFFNYMGENSVSADLCKHCGRYFVAHQNQVYIDAIVGPHTYEPRGGWNYDIYTCWEHIGD